MQYRYYDTNTKRFLNTDDRLDFEAGIAENNLFTYAANNSVSRVDVNGHDSVVSVMIGIVLLTLVYVIAWKTVRFMSNWLKSADKIADAMVRNLKKIARTLSAEEAIAKSLWREIGKSFAKAKKKLTGREYHHIIAKKCGWSKCCKELPGIGRNQR